MGDVLQFPAKEKTCFECVHIALTGTGGSFCMLFSEQIYSERLTAQDCETYTPQ